MITKIANENILIKNYLDDWEMGNSDLISMWIHCALVLISKIRNSFLVESLSVGNASAWYSPGRGFAPTPGMWIMWDWLPCGYCCGWRHGGGVGGTRLDVRANTMCSVSTKTDYLYLLPLRSILRTEVLVTVSTWWWNQIFCLINMIVLTLW